MNRPEPRSHLDKREGPVRLLLVDDHPLMRAGVRTLFDGEQNLEVVGEAENGQKAIELAQALSPDVVLMDVSLPVLSGAEATKRILSAQPTLKILAFSTHEDAAFARMMLDAGALGYVLKRSVCDELVRGVRIVATGRVYVDAALTDVLSSRSVAGRRRSPGATPAVSLSQREIEVVKLTAHGHSSKAMAQTLGLSPRTLETYKARAMGKLQLHSRADLVRYALRCGWLRDS